MVSDFLPDDARRSLLLAAETPDWPDDWSDWGEVLPLTQTVGEVHRAMVLREDLPVAVVTWHAGLVRAQFRADGYHDLAVYAVLRSNPSGGKT